MIITTSQSEMKLSYFALFFPDSHIIMLKIQLKKIFGGQVASRAIENQAIKLSLRCHMLNKMNQLGMPDTFKK